MDRRIAIIQGHPDREGRRFCHALADAYVAGALESGHAVRRIEVSQLDFPLLGSWAEFYQGELPPGLTDAQTTIRWADHLVIVYPLWLGAMPALLKGFFEQVMRPGTAFEMPDGARGWRTLLDGRSARIVVTMGMPALAYRWWYRAHSLKALERNILRFVGVAPTKHTLIGMVDALSDARRQQWLDHLQALGRMAD